MLKSILNNVSIYLLLMVNLKKEYIRKLIDNIDDGSHDMTYDEVVERLVHLRKFISYYEQEDMDNLD